MGWYAVVVGVIAAVVAGGCTPLAKTAHPVVWDEGLMGEWALTLNPELGDAEKELPSVVLSIGPKEEARAGRRGEEERQEEAPIGRRQRIIIGAAVDDEEIGKMVLVGGVVRAGGRVFLTAQHALAEYEPTHSLLHTPLQYTVWIGRDGDEMRIWFHPVILVWTPAEFAGDMQLELPPPTQRDEVRLLVQRFDDIIAYYADAPEETWVLLGEAKRVVEE